MNPAMIRGFKKHGLQKILLRVVCLLGLVFLAHANERPHQPSIPFKQNSSVDSSQNPRLKLVPEVYKGKCPVDLRAEGVFPANENGQIQYRWVFNGGMGKITHLRLMQNAPNIVTTTFPAIGKPHSPDTHILSSKISSKLADKLHTGTIQLLTLPIDDEDWQQAGKSPEVRFSIECESDANPVMSNKHYSKADLVPGPNLTIGGATAPWGNTLAVDARPLLGARRGNECPLPLVYEVFNHGMSESAASQSRVMKGTDTLSNQPIDQLSPSAKIRVMDTIYLSDGRHQLSVKLDDLNQVDESSEANNVQSMTVMVRGCAH